MSKYTANPKKYLQAALDNLHLFNVQRSEYFNILIDLPEPIHAEFDEYQKSLQHQVVNLQGEQVLTTLTNRKIHGEIYTDEKIFLSFDIGNYAVIIVHHKSRIIATVFEIENVYTIAEDHPMMILYMKAADDYKFLLVNADLVNKKLMEIAYRIEVLYNFLYLTYFKEDEDISRIG